MKTLIVFASSHGTTEKVANYIAGHLDTNEVVNIKKINEKDLQSYDAIIIGASIHAGNVQRNIKNFLVNNKELLLSKPLALFLSCMNKEAYQEQLEKAFPEELRSHALSVKIVGGAFVFEKMNFFEKAIIKKIAGVKKTVIKIDYEKADELIADFKMAMT